MRKLFLLSTFLVVHLLAWPPKHYGQRTPIPPGIRQADKQTNTPIEPPAKFKQKPTDPAVLKQEAEELAKLSTGVPAQVEQVSQGKVPKDLAEQLKRIEKLAKHLRSEIVP